MTERRAASDGSDALLVAALKSRDEATFVALVRRYHGLMLRIAFARLRNRAIAEEVVQETWLAVIEGIDSFEGRSSLRTWMFKILTYQTFSRLKRDGRQVPFSALAAAEDPDGEQSIAATLSVERNGHQRHVRWGSEPTAWPETALLAAEARSLIAAAIDALPDNQRAVISLRDLEGWTPAEVCKALEITDVNQRVLLHRARSTVQAALDGYVRGPG